MPRDDSAAILDMLRAARLAVEFGGTLSRLDFMLDLKTQSSVVHQLLVLGEACKRLTDRFQQQHEEIPWRQVAGMRDVLIHQYDSVDLAEVWRTLTIDLPPLVAFLERHAPLSPPK